jgi:putative Mg2+ transporter-C (MgtC) family protein
VRLHLTYLDGRGAMHQILQICDRHHWQLTELSSDAPATESSGQVGVLLTLAGTAILQAPTILAAVDGVTSLRQLDEEAD